METTDATASETAVLVGGPADGTRIRVTDRPRVIQVTYPCPVDGTPPGLRAEGVFVYRRDYGVKSEPLRYGFDVASP
ncbi:hypothetical protein [Streptomyces sp. MMG1121]|uniref:hypothetical protein n=1 Tax=Streptomyces sp. MMG1121 TaxID=1415544 RepID=UPI0006ADE0EE|nr:hypothetical protein [Streptomyces sp. MMG1121]